MSTLIQRMKQQGCSTIFVIGDLNACIPGERHGYSDTDRSMDYTLQSWINSEQLQTGISRPRWTWKGGKGRTKRANLDHIL
eukprot:1750497-Rhodomonas_salina.1